MRYIKYLTHTLYCMDLKRVIDPVLWIAGILVSLCFIVTDLTNDMRIYLGVEHIAANYYPFPEGIDLAWEIKPIFNRVINFVLYKIATLFVPFEDHFLFGVAVKLLVLGMIIFVAWYFSRWVRGMFYHDIDSKYIFATVFFSFTTVGNFCIGQAEYFAVLFTVFAIALLLSDFFPANFLGGVIMACVFLTKGVTGLLLISCVCGWFLLKRQWVDGTDFLPYMPDLKVFIAGFIAAGYGFYVMAVLFWHNMISDILISPHLARVGIAAIQNVLIWFFAQLVICPLHIPVLIIGLPFAAIFWFAWVRRQERMTRYAYLLLWLVPCLIVIIQGELFIYHYLAFVPSAIVTMVMVEREVVA